MQLTQLHHSHGEEQLLEKKKRKEKSTGMVNASEVSSTSYSLAVAGWSELTSNQTL